MINLIIKDIVIQKKNLLYAFFYTIFISICFFSSAGSIALYVVSPVIVTYLLITNAVNYDEKNKTEIIFNSLPLKRNDIVISKYISIFVFVIIGIIYSIIIGCVGKTTGLPMFSGSISLVDIFLILISVCIFGSIFFPPYFKFGYIKARIFNIMLFMMILFLPMLFIDSPSNILVQKFNYFINSTSSLMRYSLALIIGLIIFISSVMISIQIYKNKEF